jgi:hypothetical protein
MRNREINPKRVTIKTPTDTFTGFRTQASMGCMEKQSDEWSQQEYLPPGNHDKRTVRMLLTLCWKENVILS